MHERFGRAFRGGAVARSFADLSADDGAGAWKKERQDGGGEWSGSPADEFSENVRSQGQRDGFARIEAAGDVALPGKVFHRWGGDREQGVCQRGIRGSTGKIHRASERRGAADERQWKSSCWGFVEHQGFAGALTPSRRLTYTDVRFVKVDFPRQLRTLLVIEFSDGLSLLLEHQAAIPLTAEFIAFFRKYLANLRS